MLFRKLVLLFIKLFIYNNRAWDNLCEDCDSAIKSKKVNNQCICDDSDYRIYETDQCVCKDNFKEVKGLCECDSLENKIKFGTNCVCKDKFK